MTKQELLARMHIRSDRLDNLEEALDDLSDILTEAIEAAQEVMLRANDAEALFDVGDMGQVVLQMKRDLIPALGKYLESRHQPASIRHLREVISKAVDAQKESDTVTEATIDLDDEATLELESQTVWTGTLKAVRP